MVGQEEVGWYPYFLGMEGALFEVFHVLSIACILSFSSLEANNTTNIKIGILLAQRVLNNTWWKSGNFYASAFQIAVDRINDDPQLLHGHKLEYVYNDTECSEEKSIQLFHYQVCQMNVAGVIGLGCSKCDGLAKYAGAINVNMVSHVSILILLLLLE